MRCAPARVHRRIAPGIAAPALKTRRARIETRKSLIFPGLRVLFLRGLQKN
jgi:hypothetical protein